MSEEEQTPRMAKARLLTRDGGFVTCAEVLPFNTWPDVLVWGTRIFQKTAEADDTKDQANYFEAFAHYVIYDSSEDPDAA